MKSKLNTTMTAVMVAIALGTSACASLKVDEGRMKEVRKVAIVGFDILQQQPVKTMDLLKIATHQKTGNGGIGVAGRNELPYVAELYDVIAGKLAKERGLTVMGQKELTNHPAYARLFKAKTEGLQSRPMIPERYEMYQAPKVLDVFAFRGLSEDEKKQLQEALKVDAVMIVQSMVDLNMSGVMASLVGQATMSPSANTNVVMMDARTGQEIWSDPKAAGKPVENSEKSFLGMKEESKVHALAKTAVENSFDSALERLKPSAN